MCICLGPIKSGKTLLLKNLRGDIIDDASNSVPTNGLNLFNVRNSDGRFEIEVREIGGSMAPIWKHHLDKVLHIYIYYTAISFYYKCEINCEILIYRHTK